MTDDTPLTNTQIAFNEGERQAAEADAMESGNRPLSPYQSDEMTKAFFHGFDSYWHHKVMDEIDCHQLDLEADERDEEFKRTEDNSDPLTTTIEDTYNEQ